MESTVSPAKNDPNIENVSNTNILEPEEDGLIEPSPFLLQDVTNELPRSFLTLLSYLPENTIDSNKIIVAVLYTLAVESGFTWNFDAAQPVSERCYTFQKTRMDTIAPETLILAVNGNQEYALNVFLGSVNDFPCVLLMTPCLNGMLVNFYTTSINPSVSFSKVLPTPQYFTENRLILEKMQDLSIECKNDLFYPMKVHILGENGIKSASLLDLPFEILFNIIKKLDFKDFCNFCSTCSYLNDNFSRSENIWKNYCLKHGFPNIITNSWRINFIDSWKREKSGRRNSIKCIEFRPYGELTFLLS